MFQLQGLLVLLLRAAIGVSLLPLLVGLEEDEHIGSFLLQCGTY
jgi:hypothetical protein